MAALLAKVKDLSDDSSGKAKKHAKDLSRLENLLDATKKDVRKEVKKIRDSFHGTDW